MARNKKARTTPVTAGAIRYKTKDIDALIAQLGTLDIDDPFSDTDTDTDTEPPRPFRFFALPAELRLRILELLLAKPHTIDLDPSNSRTLLPCLRLFYVSRRMHAEASHVFYSANTFRVFTVNGRFFRTKKQLLSRLPSHYLTHIRSLELRLGTGWTKPPPTWVVDARLKLNAAVNVRLLKVFVELDPGGHPSFEGYGPGAAEEYFTTFSVGLMRGLFGHLGNLQKVEFDANPGVSRNGTLVSALVEETRGCGKEVGWGPQRGWEKIVDVDLGGMLMKLGIEGL